MKLVFSGLENSLHINAGQISVLQIASKPLFARICQSLFAEDDIDNLEPFSLWDNDGKELNIKQNTMPVLNPFDLPWHDKGLKEALYKNMTERLDENDALKNEVEAAHRQFIQLLSQLSLSYNANYTFNLDWTLSQSLKAFGFCIDRQDVETLFDNLIRFIEFISDICYKKPLFFVNLDKFLTNELLLEFKNLVFFYNIPVVILSQGKEDLSAISDENLYIDLDLLEYCK